MCHCILMPYERSESVHKVTLLTINCLITVWNFTYEAMKWHPTPNRDMANMPT